VFARSAVVVGYFVVLLGIGFLARRRASGTVDDYFVASRNLPLVVLFLTMAATNFSAFTVFGFSGEGWRVGYSFYPIMAFGTGFMALSFHFIGRPVWKLGKERGLLTPPELIFDRFGSTPLRLVFFLVLTVFTLPYLAMQPMAAGYALHGLLGIPYLAGAALITGVMLLYTFFGGMRGVAWTDVLQGGAFIVLLIVALAMIAAPFGGLTAANRAAAAELPHLFSRPGVGDTLGPGIWLGYMLLWLLCDPMFPQIFQRFYAARHEKTLGMTMSLYPLITGGLFLLPVAIGVVGRLAFPSLPAETTSDQILPLLLGKYVPPVVEALVLTAALAALMSTLDSQLLTLSSMFTRDLVEPLAGRNLRAAPWIGKLFVVALALVGLAIAWRPPATFLAIATETFTGLAVLFPTVVSGLYWRRATAKGAIASIIVGEGLVIAYHFHLPPTFGTLPVVPVVAATAIVLVAVSLVTHPHQRACRPVNQSRTMQSGWKWAAVFIAMFVLGNDFWDWGDGRLGPLGFPWWVWYSLGLCVTLAALFWILTVRSGVKTETAVHGNDAGG
jgi:solute:Na+ symporter, SSS family